MQKRLINVVDLFSGAGGLTFGFQFKIDNNEFIRNRSFKILFANEIDKAASMTFQKNFPDINMINKDIKKIDYNEIKSIIGDKQVDIIIGGPPCQSFSTIGKRIYDDKAKMYIEYLRILKIIKPKMFIFENVRGILSMREVFYKRDNQGKLIYEEMKKASGRTYKKPIIDHFGEKILDKIIKEFNNIEPNFGYQIKYKVLNAADFGVPQNRERVFIVGVRNDLNYIWDFPKENLECKITIKQAIGDLPSLMPGEVASDYECLPQNNYQALMRKNCDKLTLHYSSNYGTKIRTIIEHVPQGKGKQYFNSLVQNGLMDSKYVITSGYANTYSRLMENEPCTTITNNFGTPSSLRCIHYSDNRALSPREAARIQSFPDWFVFLGNKGEISTQIGNAVPPLLSIAIATSVLSLFGE